MRANNLPDKWCCEPLREVATINYGKSPKEILSDEGTIPVVGTGGVERYGNACLYDNESIILGRKGTIDKVAYVDGKFWAIDTTYYLSDFQDANVRWLYYFLQTIDFRLLNEATGVPSLSRELLYKISVLRPTPEEQTQIATILSTLDRAIEQTEAIIAKQQRIKAGLMQDLLTKGIDEHGVIRSEATHQFKDSQLGRIPVEWEVTPVGGHLVTLEQGWSPDCETEPAASGEWGVLKTTSVTWDGYSSKENKRLPLNLKPRPRLEIHCGDVLVTRAGPNSRVGVVSYVYSTEPKRMLSDKLYRLIPSDDLDSRFLAYSLSGFKSQLHLSTLKTGMAESQTNISQAIVKSMLTVFPEKLEQVRIADYIDEVCRHCEQGVLSLNKLKNSKTGLMHDLLTGTVRVN